MRFDRFERTDVDYTAETVGLWPGLAGVYIETHADIYCPKCGHDIVGSETFDRLKEGTVGYNHPQSDKLGNVAAVLSDEETDCPGDNCGHCGIKLDTRTIHYDGVCRPDWCPETDANQSKGDSL